MTEDVDRFVRDVTAAVEADKAKKDADWEAMLVDHSQKDNLISGRESTRVLNQDEIDSLLGFEDDPPPPKWNDWRKQWEYISGIHWRVIFFPFSWHLAAWRANNGFLNLSVGPLQFGIYWPWL